MFGGLFKKLFKKRKEYELVSLKELPDWLKNKEVEVKKGFLERASQAEQEWSSLLNLIAEKLDNLEKAQLKNPKITEREKHFMEGNRAELIRRTKQFIARLSFPKELEEFKEFFTNFTQALQGYAKGVQRPTQILNEFFALEVREVHSAIAQLEKLVNELKKTHLDARFEAYQALGSMIQDFEQQNNRLKELQKQHDELKEKEQITQNMITGINKELELLRQSKAYFAPLEEIAQARDKAKKTEQEIREFFSALMDAFKRLAHDVPEYQKMLNPYFEDPVKALIYDYKLQILKTIPKLKSVIEELKDKKKLRASEAMKNFTKENLARLLHEYARLTKEEQRLKVEKEALPVFMRLKRFEQEREKRSQELARMRQEIERASKELSKLDLVEIEKGIKSGLAEISVKLAD